MWNNNASFEVDHEQLLETWQFTDILDLEISTTSPHTDFSAVYSPYCAILYCVKDFIYHGQDVNNTTSTLVTSCLIDHYVYIYAHTQRLHSCTFVVLSYVSSVYCEKWTKTPQCSSLQTTKLILNLLVN